MIKEIKLLKNRNSKKSLGKFLDGKLLLNKEGVKFLEKMEKRIISSCPYSCGYTLPEYKYNKKPNYYNSEGVFQYHLGNVIENKQINKLRND